MDFGSHSEYNDLRVDAKWKQGELLNKVLVDYYFKKHWVSYQVQLLSLPHVKVAEAEGLQRQATMNAGTILKLFFFSCLHRFSAKPENHCVDMPLKHLVASGLVSFLTFPKSLCYFCLVGLKIATVSDRSEHSSLQTKQTNKKQQPQPSLIMQQLVPHPWFLSSWASEYEPRFVLF